MKKAIKLHCYHCAVWQVIPIEQNPETVVAYFQVLTKSDVTDAEVEEAWDSILHYTSEPFATFRDQFEGGGVYKNGIPQTREIHTDHDGNQLEIIGNFSGLDFCAG
jgi:hypothetical protein